MDMRRQLRYARSVDTLTIRPGLLVRLLRAVGLVKVEPKTGKIDHSAGADFVPDLAFRGGYDPKAALSALASFPWPFACVQAISTDMSKLPLRVARGEGADAEVLDSHPVLDLLNQPSSRVGSTLFRRQLYTDLVLTGNAFILMAGSGGEPQALLRLHPSRISIAPMPDGQVDQYQYDAGSGQPMRYEFDQVLHVRSPSWSDEPTNLWGTGCVQPLHNDLTTELAQSALTARTASTGQPTGILSPREEGDRWSKEQITTLRSAYESQMQSGGSGVLILGGQAQFEKMSFTPREMEFSAVRDFVRSSTLAAFDVPPARVGLPNTNYATALAQSKRYWEGLQGRASLIDAELTRLAKLFDPSLSVHHDFSAVESLQESRSARLERVQTWAMMGVPLSEAAAYEGFDDLPFTPEDDVEADDQAPVDDADQAPTEDTDNEPAADSTEEPLAATALNGAQIASLLQILGSVAMGAITFDAALALIGVAFPTIPEDEAVRILQGAQDVDPEAAEAETDQRIDRAKYDEIDFSVPDGVTDELAKGLAWHEDGHSGDGLTPATVSWARRMVNGEDISPDKAVKMRAWLARHEADKQGEGFSPGEDGFPSPGRVAWALWGGDPALTWSSKLVEQMQRADEADNQNTLRQLIDSIEHRAPRDGAHWLVTASAQQVDTVWRAFIDDVQKPAERKIERVMRDYLKGHAARIAARVPKVLAQRAVGDDSIVFKIEGDWLDELMQAQAEGETLLQAMSGPLRESYELSIDTAFEKMPGELAGDFAYDPERLDRLVEDQLADLVGRRPDGKGGFIVTNSTVNDSTRKEVRRIVQTGLAEGSTVNEIQAAIMASTNISSPMRALRIARTESNRSTNAGGIAAWEQQAADAGVEVVFRWRAQPNARDSHKALHNQPRSEDGYWHSGGAKAKSPGGFGVAGLDINCRCHYTPEVIL